MSVLKVGNMPLLLWWAFKFFRFVYDFPVFWLWHAKSWFLLYSSCLQLPVMSPVMFDWLCIEHGIFINFFKNYQQYYFPSEKIHTFPCWVVREQSLIIPSQSGTELNQDCLTILIRLILSLICRERETDKPVTFTILFKGFWLRFLSCCPTQLQS